MQDKMYRIFISSTLKDLINERKVIINSILRLGHYPICMETFIATQWHQMDFIKQQLDTADMYIVILGRRYGSRIGKDKCSYTKHEYEYAKQIGLPVLALVCSENYKPKATNKMTESGNVSAWKAFRDLLLNEHHCDIWNNTKDLISKFDTSIQNLINENNDGWIKETKYQKIKRAEIDKELSTIQNNIRALTADKKPLPYDCFLEPCDKLIDIYHELQGIGITHRDRIQYKKIDYLFYIMNTKTGINNLNPIVIYRYAQFLHDFYAIEKACDIAKNYLYKCDDKLEKANTHVFLGILFWKIKKFDKSQENLHSAIDYLSQIYGSDNDELANTIYQQGNRSDIERPLKILSEIYNTYGLCSDNQNDFNSAIKYYKSAVKTARLLTEINSNQYTFKYQLYTFNLASAEYKIRDFDNATFHIDTTIFILNKCSESVDKSTRLARSYQLRGDIMAAIYNDDATNEYQKAIDLYNRVIDEKEKYGQVYIFKYKNDISWCLHKLADIYYKLGQYIRAVTVLKKAIDYREDLLLSSIGQDHNEYLLNLAESEYKLSQILFYNSNKERNETIALESNRYAVNAFFHFEQLFDSNIKAYRERYIQLTLFNIEISSYLNDSNRVQILRDKLAEINYQLDS